ncbi:uncharacterized protein JCM6883_003618 [Sporobolomyces salmoneus]|uniref:uncharacterized protein n=1 Tax=Sporobolomyces salmoneus TaxID=183962 RepID=UPI00317CEB3B
MLRSIRPVQARSWIRLQSTTATRSAAVLPTSSSSRSNPPPPVNSASSPSPSLKPQPFIPRLSNKKLQLESLSTTPHDPTRSTTLHFLDPGSSPLSLSLPNLWLRDSSIHPSHVHPSSNQKLFRTTDIPINGKLIGYGVHELPGKGDCLVTEWSTRLSTPGMDPKSVKLSVVPLSVLEGLIRGGESEGKVLGNLPESRTWDKKQLEQTLVEMDYQEYMKDDKALFRMLDGLVKDGIVFLKNVPTTEKAGHATELKRLVERIGSLRKTWYGDLWDVKAEQGSKNIAYTNLDLGLHMDLTHFDHPPRYQFLHSLLNSSVLGGESYFVDSYALAQHLLSTSPSHFSTLCTEPVHFEYRNGPHWTRFSRPTFELVPGSHQTLKAVNYSPPFQGNFLLERLRRDEKGKEVASDDTERLLELHEALGEFAKLCDDKEGKWRYTRQLQPGECVIFDNRRVLHARTAFEFTENGGEEGKGEEEKGRWLKGAYMDGDEVWSRWRVEREKQSQTPSKGRTLFV